MFGHFTFICLRCTPSILFTLLFLQPAPSSPSTMSTGKTKRITVYMLVRTSSDHEAKPTIGTSYHISSHPNPVLDPAYKWCDKKPLEDPNGGYSWRYRVVVLCDSNQDAAGTSPSSQTDIASTTSNLSGTILATDDLASGKLIKRMKEDITAKVTKILVGRNYRAELHWDGGNILARNDAHATMIFRMIRRITEHDAIYGGILFTWKWNIRQERWSLCGPQPYDAERMDSLLCGNDALVVEINTFVEQDPQFIEDSSRLSACMIFDSDVSRKLLLSERASLSSSRHVKGGGHLSLCTRQNFSSSSQQMRDCLMKEVISVSSDSMPMTRPGFPGSDTRH